MATMILDEIRKPISYPIRSGLRPGPLLNFQGQLFNADAIQKEIDAQIARVPPEHNHAFVGYWDTSNNVRLAVWGRIGDHLSYEGTLTHSPDPTGWTGVASLVGSF